jgi:hypothetical protein
MQVFQLIEQLMDLDPNAEVHFAYSYGDYWRTQVAPTVDRVTEGAVVYSEYHRMHKLVDEEELHEDEGDTETLQRVVVLG